MERCIFALSTYTIKYIDNLNQGKLLHKQMLWCKAGCFFQSLYGQYKLVFIKQTICKEMAAYLHKIVYFISILKTWFPLEQYHH